MNITGKTKLCIIIGDPVEHSLSPAMHNAAYVELGIDHEFVFVASQVKVAHVKDVVTAMRVMGFRGLTCTIPHKIAVMKYLDEIDPIAAKIGAVNTVVNDNGILKGYNTDWLGVVVPLENILMKNVGTSLDLSLRNKRVALIGAGGAARACGYGVIEKGATLTIFNRTVEKAERLAEEFGKNVGTGKYVGTGRDLSLHEYDIILNATNIGMGDLINETPVPKSAICEHHLVFDAVYSPFETQLLKDAKEQGATIIHGTEMLLHQGTAQFELYTGKKAPEQVMRKALEQKSK